MIADDDENARMVAFESVFTLLNVRAENHTSLFEIVNRVAVVLNVTTIALLVPSILSFLAMVIPALRVIFAVIRMMS